MASLVSRENTIYQQKAKKLEILEEEVGSTPSQLELLSFLLMLNFIS